MPKNTNPNALTIDQIRRGSDSLDDLSDRKIRRIVIQAQHMTEYRTGPRLGTPGVSRGGTPLAE